MDNTQVNIDWMLECEARLLKPIWDQLPADQKSKLIKEFWNQVRCVWKKAAAEEIVEFLSHSNSADSDFQLSEKLAQPIPSFDFYPKAKPFWELIKEEVHDSQKRFDTLLSNTDRKWVRNNDRIPSLPEYVTKCECNPNYDRKTNRFGVSDEIVPDDMAKWLGEMQRTLKPNSRRKKFPEVFLSYEDPPAFDDRLKKKYEEDSKNYNVVSHNEPNTEAELEDCVEKNFFSNNQTKPDTERLLGCYYWNDKKIIIWMKGVRFCSKQLNLSEEFLFDCVLIHELGHWFNATASTENGVEWDTKQIEVYTSTRNEVPNHPDPEKPDEPLGNKIEGNARSLSSRCYHEAWAQLFAWLYGKEKDSDLLKAFSALEPKQSHPYQAWRKLINNYSQTDYNSLELKFKIKLILNSLEWSRSLNDNTPPPTGPNPLPATFDDPQYQNTNMLNRLNT